MKYQSRRPAFQSYSPTDEDEKLREIVNDANTYAQKQQEYESTQQEYGSTQQEYGSTQQEDDATLSKSNYEEELSYDPYQWKVNDISNKMVDPSTTGPEKIEYAKDIEKLDSERFYPEDPDNPSGDLRPEYGRVPQSTKDEFGLDDESFGTESTKDEFGLDNESLSPKRNIISVGSGSRGLNISDPPEMLKRAMDPNFDITAPVKRYMNDFSADTQMAMDPDPQSGESRFDNAAQSLNQLTRGLTFGASDPIAANIRANLRVDQFADMAKRTFNGDIPSFREIRETTNDFLGRNGGEGYDRVAMDKERYLREMREAREEFEKKYEKLAKGLELTGNLLSGNEAFKAAAAGAGKVAGVAERYLAPEAASAVKTAVANPIVKGAVEGGAGIVPISVAQTYGQREQIGAQNAVPGATQEPMPNYGSRLAKDIAISAGLGAGLSALLPSLAVNPFTRTVNVLNKIAPNSRIAYYAKNVENIKTAKSEEELSMALRQFDEAISTQVEAGEISIQESTKIRDSVIKDFSEGTAGALPENYVQQVAPKLEEIGVSRANARPIAENKKIINTKTREKISAESEVNAEKNYQDQLSIKERVKQSEIEKTKGSISDIENQIKQTKDTGNRILEGDKKSVGNVTEPAMGSLQKKRAKAEDYSIKARKLLDSKNETQSIDNAISKLEAYRDGKITQETEIIAPATKTSEAVTRQSAATPADDILIKEINKQIESLVAQKKPSGKITEAKMQEVIDRIRAGSDYSTPQSSAMSEIRKRIANDLSTDLKNGITDPTRKKGYSVLMGESHNILNRVEQIDRQLGIDSSVYSRKLTPDQLKSKFSGMSIKDKEAAIDLTKIMHEEGMAKEAKSFVDNINSKAITEDKYALEIYHDYGKDEAIKYIRNPQTYSPPLEFTGDAGLLKKRIGSMKETTLPISEESLNNIRDLKIQSNIKLSSKTNRFSKIKSDISDIEKANGIIESEMKAISGEKGKELDLKNKDLLEIKKIQDTMRSMHDKFHGEQSVTGKGAVNLSSERIIKLEQLKRDHKDAVMRIFADKSPEDMLRLAKKIDGKLSPKSEENFDRWYREFEKSDALKKYNEMGTKIDRRSLKRSFYTAMLVGSFTATGAGVLGKIGPAEALSIGVAAGTITALSDLFLPKAVHQILKLGVNTARLTEKGVFDELTKILGKDETRRAMIVYQQMKRNNQEKK